jgi:hypothetical protein
MIAGLTGDIFLDSFQQENVLYITHLRVLAVKQLWKAGKGRYFCLLDGH